MCVRSSFSALANFWSLQTFASLKLKRFGSLAGQFTDMNGSWTKNDYFSTFGNKRFRQSTDIVPSFVPTRANFVVAVRRSDFKITISKIFQCCLADGTKAEELHRTGNPTFSMVHFALLKCPWKDPKTACPDVINLEQRDESLHRNPDEPAGTTTTTYPG